MKSAMRNEKYQSLQVRGTTIDLSSMSRKTRRKLYVFAFAVMYAFVFFEAGILYQDKYRRMRHKAGQKTVQESKVLRTKELLSDFHHEPHILLQSALRGKVHNDTSLGKTTSSLESLKRVKLSNTDGSDFLVI